MPPVKRVQSLYFLCLDCVFKSLFEEIVGGFVSNKLEKIRRHFVTNLHGGIREHILKLAVLRDRNRMDVLLQLINILIDPSVTYLCMYSGRTFRILPQHYFTLVTHLKKRNATGLKFLHVIVDYTRPEYVCDDPVVKTNAILHSLLADGLAKNLTVLVLRSCCDNEVLRILGQHCIHLAKLDMTKSWYVNDNGIKNLCLKNPDCVEDMCEKDSRSPQFILKLMSLKANVLNPCCFTLCDVRLQETNTTNVAVLMLLLFLKNLKRLGGFIYSRSVVDNIVLLSRLAEGKLRMKFTELYETHLTDSKLNHLSNVLPELTAVYTRTIYLPPMLAKFRKLSEITIDFDFLPYEENFFVFLTNCGSQLKRITLVDEHGFTDMLRIFKYCPNLVEINGPLTINDTKRRFTVPHLIKANLKIRSPDVISWLLVNASKLEHLDANLFHSNHHSRENEAPNFNDEFFVNIMREKPSCFGTLKHLIVIPIINSPVAKQTVFELILQCKELRLIGDLSTWGIFQYEVHDIINELRSMNLDVRVMWARIYESEITMNSIEEMNMSTVLKPGIEKQY